MLKRLLMIALFAVVAAETAAAPVASKWDDREQVSVRLVAATDGLGTDGVVRAGIEFQLKPGWKVYWRSPGDAGFPPIPDFTESDNATASDLDWPAPHRFSVLGLETLGYKDSVILPFTLTANDPTQPATLKTHIRYLTCDDICIPYEADLEMQVPLGGGALTPLAHSINKFDALVPKTGTDARLTVEHLSAYVEGDGLYLVANARSALPLSQPDLFIEGPASLTYGAPKTTLSADGAEATFRVALGGYEGSPSAAVENLSSAPFTLTIVDGMRAVETTLPLGEASAAAATSEPPLALILAFALLGGLILNLMPCVLPVLSLKLMGAIKLGGSHPRDVRMGFLASAAGIVFGFAVLAGALIALKSLGAGIGWGIQFQQPWFLILMAFAVTLFACNMWGLFEIRLTGKVVDAALAGSEQGGHAGHFMQGVFATLLATPCSAPFLGTAVGFALSRGAGEIALVFACLGLGLAAPYLLVAAFPGLARLLPKPGPWMRSLRIVLGLALLGTAVWLAFVLAGSAGTDAALGLAGALAATILWFAFRQTNPIFAGRLTAPLLIVLVAVPMIGAYQGHAVSKEGQRASISPITWQAFEPGRIPALVAAGNTVFVDITADWCITCAVNKRLVLETEKFTNILNKPNVIAMQGDWTRPDPKISAYLASFGRYGIPFNAIYGSDAPSGHALPELLTPDSVLAGFKSAAPDVIAAAAQ